MHLHFFQRTTVDKTIVVSRIRGQSEHASIYNVYTSSAALEHGVLRWLYQARVPPTATDPHKLRVNPPIHLSSPIPLNDDNEYPPNCDGTLQERQVGCIVSSQYHN